MRKIVLLLLVIATRLTVQAQVKTNKIYFIDMHNDVLSKQMITGEDIAKEQLIH